MPIQTKLPYLPKNKKILYIPENNKYLEEAKKVAENHSLDTFQPVGCVIIKENKIIGIGANGSDYHKTHTCRRKELGTKTGEGYELCEGCHPKNHAEASAINAIKQKFPENFLEILSGSDLYLYGHWWCCKNCWDQIIQVKIKNVYLWDKSQEKFK